MMKIIPYRAILIAMITGCCAAGCDTPGNVNERQAAGDFFLAEITIGELQEAYRNGTYTITGVVQAYLDRIETIDRNGPSLNAIIITNPDAIRIAETLDQELDAGKIRGPLHGIPVVLKDNIDTHDKMPTTAGSLALKDSYPLQDSWIAARLREAGAVILAKANLSEWANFRADFSSSGWSGVGGQTKNPYVLDRNPCGSSSGSGVAVSANLCVLAIGTETNGSIVCPSNANGIVGIKPTVGLLSRAGIVPISFTQDTPGPMARTVEDAAICLGALVGVDAADPKTSASVDHYHEDYTTYLKEDGLSGKRIGLLRDAMGYHHRVDSVMMANVELLKASGVEVLEVEFPGKDFNQPSYQVMLYEFKHGLNQYFASLGAGAPVKNLEELIEFNKATPAEMRYFNQALIEMAQEKEGLESSAYREALEKMHEQTRENGIDQLMDEHQLDALMAPTGTPAWKTDLIVGDRYMGSSSSYAAISGYPNITVPMGFIDGLPLGVSFFGKAWTEPLLLEIAYGFEQASRQRKPPRFLSNAHP